MFVPGPRRWFSRVIWGVGDVEWWGVPGSSRGGATAPVAVGPGKIPEVLRTFSLGWLCESVFGWLVAVSWWWSWVMDEVLGSGGGPESWGWSWVWSLLCGSGPGRWNPRGVGFPEIEIGARRECFFLMGVLYVCVLMIFLSHWEWVFFDDGDEIVWEVWVKWWE